MALKCSMQPSLQIEMPHPLCSYLTLDKLIILDCISGWNDWSPYWVPGMCYIISFVLAGLDISSVHLSLTLKHPGHLFQNVILVCRIICCKWNICIWNHSNTMVTYLAMWILKACCFGCIFTAFWTFWGFVNIKLQQYQNTPIKTRNQCKDKTIFFFW